MISNCELSTIACSEVALRVVENFKWELLRLIRYDRDLDQTCATQGHDSNLLRPVYFRVTHLRGYSPYWYAVGPERISEPK